MSPLLSVVMPTYNGERYVRTALESVREQDSDRDIEVVVVDDGSSDSTLSIVREFQRVLPIRLVTPGRLGNWVATTSLGLREASAEWACILHQDDFWLPGRMARLRQAMETADGPLVLHDAIFVGPDGRKLGRWTCPLKPGTVLSERMIDRLLVQNFIAMPAPAFRRQAVIDSGGLDEALWFSADWDLWLRLAAMGPVSFLAETLCAFRVHDESQTAARKVSPGEWENQLTTVLERHLPRWVASGRASESVERAARASIAVNSALAAASRGEPVPVSTVVRRLAALRPTDWYRYLRDSRIRQRVGSRLALRWFGKEK